MKKADKIKFELMRYCRSHPYDIVIPNFFVGRYEMDIFKLTQTGYIIEYEIKVSRSDFFADFKKCYSVYNFGKVNKHDEIAYNKSSCNRFFFVVPKGLISANECPVHSGLLYFNGYSFDMIKNAPLIHKQKQDQSIYKKIALKLSFRSVTIEAKYRHELRNHKQEEVAIGDLDNEFGKIKVV